MIRLITALALAALATPALAQTGRGPGPDRSTPYTSPEATSSIFLEDNNTGGDTSVTIPRGPNGADTFQSDSAAGGNAGQPARAVPQGSSGGSSGSGSGG